MTKYDNSRPATRDELAAAFDDPAFVLACMNGRKTMLQAKSDFCDVLQKQLPSPPKSSDGPLLPRGGLGSRGVPSGYSRGNAHQDVGSFDEAVRVEMAKQATPDRRAAVRYVMRKHPDLHEAYVRQHNSRDRHTQRMIFDKFADEQDERDRLRGRGSF